MRISIFTALLICWIGGWAQSPEEKISQLMEEHLVMKGKTPVPNFLLYAHNQQNGRTFHTSAGVLGRDESPIDSSYQFNIASITKTFVSVIVLQMVEEGKLSLDDLAGNYLDDIPFIRYEEFLIHEKSSVSDKITIRMLLNHTSGIPDVFTDAETRFFLSVYLHPKRKYTPQSFVKKYFSYKLHKKPVNLPGEGFHYSDMNYMLLGFIIEKLGNTTLHEAIRERILIPLGMKETFFVYYETEGDTGKRIDAFLNKLNLTKRVNTSYEWAGGGLVATTRDLALFIEGLFEGKLFQKAKTLEQMTDISLTEAFGGNYGLGIYKFSISEVSYYGHGGFYGSIMLYSPEEKITLVTNVGQANAPWHTGKMLNEVITILKM